MPETSWRLFRFALPLRISLPSGARVRQGWLIQIQQAEAVGWGEVAPLPGFSRETLDEAGRILQDRLFRLTSFPPEITWAEWAEAVEQSLESVPASVRWGVELALAQCQAARRGKRLDTWLAPDPLPMVSINALIPIDWREHPERLQAIRAAGYQAVKVKVGQHAPKEAAQDVRLLRNLLGPEVELRVDANRAWSLREALTFAEAIADRNVAYLEEPLRDPAELHDFVRRSPVPVALDETLAEQPDVPLHCWEGVAAVVLKPALIGGLLRAWQRAREANALGMTVVWSAAFETGVGTRGLLALAAASHSKAAAGLDPYHWLADDVVYPRLALHPATRVADALTGPWRLNAAVLEEVNEHA
ncbi:o-succinylbenzoate synthase [Rhodothermus profundi]|uniref:o-succinylbenzoate synthase n=1 Tax=Rhodothermus profundi TaxID=633813 RepID=A0A1M6Q6T5_9BACT|nr:o-succinylbenzoate synthase [Rhodothermus profundi]SHK15962.1 O-succinylbenzoate synthase [Rhodothermus profundi]